MSLARSSRLVHRACNLRTTQCSAAALHTVGFSVTSGTPHSPGSLQSSTIPVAIATGPRRFVSHLIDSVDIPDREIEHQETEVIFADEIIKVLNPSERGGIFLDFTFGAGGHTRKILESDSDVKVIAIDRDPSAEEAADKLKQRFPGRLCFLNIKFSGAVAALSQLGVGGGSIAGAVLDVGPSVAQLTEPNRGFCSTAKHRLDMRMGGPASGEMTALTVLQHIDEASLYRVLRDYGTSKHAKKLSRALIQARYEMIDIRTPDDLIDVITRILGKNPTEEASLLLQQDKWMQPDEQEKRMQQDQRKKRMEVQPEEQEHGQDLEQQRSYEDQQGLVEGHVHSAAASTFQALRILVNDELNELDCAIRSAHHLLKADAPLAVVTYNSLEDTITKRHFKGINIDASPCFIGRPQHRLAKVVGITRLDECRPWTMQTKHSQTLPRDTLRHWRTAELRVGGANADVAYDRQE